MAEQVKSEDALTRQQLYVLVWSEPITTIVTRFGISNVAFAKACKRHQIPVPPRGYWAKIQSGHKAHKQPLPERGLGMPEIIRFGGGPYHWAYAGIPANLIEIEIAPPPEFTETLSELIDRVRALVSKVAFPKTLNNPHPVIAKVLDADNARHQRQLSSPYPWSSDAPLFESPFERRRLKLLNAIFMGLHKVDSPHRLSERILRISLPGLASKVCPSSWTILNNSDMDTGHQATRTDQHPISCDSRYPIGKSHPACSWSGRMTGKIS